MVWLKLSEAANRLGLSEITLRRRVKNGQILNEFREGKYYVNLPNETTENKNIFKPEITPIKNSEPKFKNKPTLSSLQQKPSSIELQQLAQLRAALTEKISTIESMKRKIENQETLINVLESRLIKNQKK